MNAPIIFVHKSNSYYLHAALLKAHMTNPTHDIILIGDETNDRYSFVKHYNISDYMSSANKFAKIYIHHSPNPYNFELFCFQRWFVIKDFIEKYYKGSDFFYCDTDTLLFIDIKDELQKWRKYHFTICRTGTPCFTYFNSNCINDFTSFIYERYSTEDGKKMIEEYANRLIKQNRRYGISDMTAFMAYENISGIKCLHVDSIIQGTSYGHNFQDAKDGYEMRDNHYNVIDKLSLPKCRFISTNEMIIFKGLHFQGISKRYMPSFFPLYWRLILSFKRFIQKINYKWHRLIIKFSQKNNC